MNKEEFQRIKREISLEKWAQFSKIAFDVLELGFDIILEKENQNEPDSQKIEQYNQAYKKFINKREKINKGKEFLLRIKKIEPFDFLTK